jgi:cytochrome c oxidase cbb3-type subunit I/II
LWTEPEPDVFAELSETKNQPRKWIARINIIHAAIERWPVTFLVLTGLTLSVGSFCEIVPNMMQGALTPKIESIQPYTPLELAGRDIYIREGCVNCHTQMVRTLRADTARYGEYTRPGEGIYERPFLWGSKRTGPDLARVGVGRLSGATGMLWHWAHMYNPQETSEGTVMPAYAYLYAGEIDYKILGKKLEMLQLLGTPYSTEQIANAERDARSQAEQVVAILEKQNAQAALIPALPENVADKEIVALIAYLARLGTDLEK